MIVNADSAQVYRDLPILSAAPSPADRARADHRLYGVRDGASPCSAADWAQMAKAEIAAIHEADRMPILDGGTGLYIRTLLDGIAPVPEIETAIRAEVRSAATSHNYSRLADLDPEAAKRLNATDTTRIARALEVVLSSGRPLHEWQAERVGGIGDQVELRPLVLLPPRPCLYERCDRRFAAMVEQGALDEVSELLDRKLDPALPVMRAIGVPELSDFVRGVTALSEAMRAGQHATRRYAKRQYTWFGNQSPATWRSVTEPIEEATIELAVSQLS